MQLVPAGGAVEEDAPLHVKLRVIVVFEEVGHGGAGVLDLLETIAVGDQCDGAISIEQVMAVHPVDDAGWAMWVGGY